MNLETLVPILLLGVGHLAVAAVQTQWSRLYRFAAASIGIGVLLLPLPVVLGDGTVVPWGIPAAVCYALGAAAGLAWHTEGRR